MAKGEAVEVSSNVSIRLEGVRDQIEALAQKYPECLRSASVREVVVADALAAAMTAAQTRLEAIEAKAAAFKPFEL